jgi:hypothetical protein
MRRGRNAAARLRAAVDLLPLETKRAMVEALDNDAIVTGAYTYDRGICPMLAAHRRGGRTDRLSFAHAWDRYTGADKGRLATGREVRALRAMLEASLLEPFDIHAISRPIPDSGKRPFIRAPRPRRPRRRARSHGVARPDELDLGHDAGGRGRQQEAHALGDIPRLNHLLPRDGAGSPVRHGGVDEAGAEDRHLDPVLGELPMRGL